MQALDHTHALPWHIQLLLAALACPSMRHPGKHPADLCQFTDCCCNVPSKTAVHKWALAHPAWNVMQAEMAGTAETAAILDALNSQRADARERQAAMERQIREEARRLRGGIAGQPHATDSSHVPFMHTGMLLCLSCPAALCCSSDSVPDCSSDSVTVTLSQAAALTLSQATAGDQLLVEQSNCDHSGRKWR